MRTRSRAVPTASANAALALPSRAPPSPWASGSGPLRVRSENRTPIVDGDERVRRLEQGRGHVGPMRAAQAQAASRTRRLPERAARSAPGAPARAGLVQQPRLRPAHHRRVACDAACAASRASSRTHGVARVGAVRRAVGPSSTKYAMMSLSPRIAERAHGPGRSPPLQSPRSGPSPTCRPRSPA